jgi:hypothetical protein
MLPTLHAVESRMVQPSVVEIEAIYLDIFIKPINYDQYVVIFLANLYYVNIYT